MDEMSMVRWLLAEPAPPPEAVAEGRERLLASTTRTRTGRAAFRRTPVLALTAAAAAGALVVAMLISGAGTAPPGGGRSVDVASARSVLLAAAVHAESAPVTGTYWHLRSLSRTTLPRRFGRPDSRYTLEQLSVREEWAKRNGQAWSGRREWVRPKTPRDEEAWRRDGAPARWCLGRTDTQPPERICLHTAPGTASLAKNHFPFEVAEGHDLTYAQLQRLPEDPHALRAWLVGITRRDLDPSASAAIVDSNVIQILANLLVYPPVAPAARAAAFRALADMPGVRSIGRTRDELGRAGVGIEIAIPGGWIVAGGSARPVETSGARKLTRTLIVDPVTSHVLADATGYGKGSDPITDTLILRVGWTNQKPHEPALP